MAAKRNAKKFEPKAILAVIVALTISALALISNSSWLFNPYGWVDHWGYLGHSLDLTNLRDVYPNDPSGDLLPVIWPSAFLYYLFPSAAASYLHGALNLSLSTFLLFQITWKNFGKKEAFLVSTMWLGSQYTLTSLGASYPTGSVIVYLMLTIFFLQRISNSKTRLYLNLVLASIAFTLSFYSALLSIIYLPGLILFAALYSQEKISIRNIKLLKGLILFLSIFIITTVVLQIVYSIYGEGFFFENNVKKLMDFTVGNAYRAPAFSQWLPTATWLILPMLICGVQILMLIRKKKSQKLPHHYFAFIALSITTFAAQVSVNLFVNQWSLQFMYFNQTLGLYFVSLAAVIAMFFMSITQKDQNKIIVISLLISLFSLNIAKTKDFNAFTPFQISPFTDYVLVHPLRSALLLSIFLLVIMHRGQYLRGFAVVSLSALVVVNIFSFSPAFGCFVCFDATARQGTWSGVSNMNQNQSSTIAVSQFIDGLDERRVFKIWYDETEPLGPVFRQINAVVYLNNRANRVSKSFPEVFEGIQPIGSGGMGLARNDKILVLSSNKDSFNQLIAKLYKLNIATSRINQREVFFGDTIPIYILTFSVK